MALHERLLAASSDFRDLQEHIGAARSVLLIIALAYVSYGTVTYLVHRHALHAEPELDAGYLAALIDDAMTAAVLLVCWQAARFAPLAAIFIATGIWFGVQVLTAVVVGPLSLFAAAWLKAAAAILLARGIVASFRANRFMRKVETQSGVVVAQQIDVSR